MMSKGEKRTLFVKTMSIKILAWISIVFCLFCAIMSWRADPGRASPASRAFVTLTFLMFVALAIYLLLSAGSVEVDEQAITYRSYLGPYRINWSEVTYIEIDSEGHNIVFCGENKRLAALGPMYWSGTDKRRILWLVGRKVEKDGIEVRQTAKAMYRFSENTKVRA